MQSDAVAQRTQDLVALMNKHLGTRAKTLEKALRRAGRQLPKGLRAKGGMLLEAEVYATHPKLMRQVDMQAVEAAVREFESYLNGIDLAEARKTRRLNMLAVVAFNFLVIVALLIIVLQWRGLI